MKGTLANAILQGKVQGKTIRGRAGEQGLGDVKEWTGLSLNDMWNLEGASESESIVLPNGLITIRESKFKKIQLSGAKLLKPLKK